MCSYNPPIDCQVSAWSAWSTCTASCGGGSQSRTRSVTQSPSGGGAACPVLSESQSCNTHGCGTPSYLLLSSLSHLDSRGLLMERLVRVDLVLGVVHAWWHAHSQPHAECRPEWRSCMHGVEHGEPGVQHGHALPYDSM